MRAWLPPLLPLLLLLLPCDLAVGCQLTSWPASVTDLTVGKFQRLSINCTCCGDDEWRTTGEADQVLMAAIFVANSQVAGVTRVASRRRQSPHEERQTVCRLGRWCTFAEADVDSPMFVEANNVGRTSLLLALTVWNSSDWRQVVERRKLNGGVRTVEEADDHLARALTSLTVPVVTRRAGRLIDAAFEWSAACVACAVALCMGSVTDLRELRPLLARPLALAVCLLLQHLALPPLAFGLTRLFDIEDDVALGLIAVAAVPGGGLAQLTVYLMGGDRNLAAAISLLNSVVNLVTSPIWLFACDRVLSLSIHLGVFAAWLLPVLASQSCGCVLATCRPSLAQALLNWIGRPLLLLSAILMVTLGVYINHYAIDYLDARTLCSVLALIGSGLAVGALAGVATRQEKPGKKSMAAETACFSSLAVIPAIRMSTDAPTSDLATIAPLVATILSPAPIVIYVVAHRLKITGANFIHRRKEKQTRHYSIVSSLAKMAEDVAAVSTHGDVAEGDEEAETERQKITTL